MEEINFLRSWICKQIENTEETYDSPAELGHIDGNDFIEVLQYVQAAIDDLGEFDGEETELD